MALNVQFGAGSNLLAGWSNHDGEVNINSPLPYADGSVDAILIEHCLEHTDCAHGLKFLDEANRILKPGGRIRICVPILARISDRNHARDLILGHGHQMLFTQESLTQMLGCAGFIKIVETKRAAVDGHWQVIGIARDDLETLRMEADKP
jgi:SAM-dependent methyltransferase